MLLLTPQKVNLSTALVATIAVQLITNVTWIMGIVTMIANAQDMLWYVVETIV